MCDPPIQLCLFTFRPIASKQLNSLTTIVTLSWLGGAEVTFGVQFPAPARVRMLLFCFVVVVFRLFFISKNTLFVTHFCIFFQLFYLVYLTLFILYYFIMFMKISCMCLILNKLFSSFLFLSYRKICDRLHGYKDTDLASLKSKVGHHIVHQPKETSLLHSTH